MITCRPSLQINSEALPLPEAFPYLGRMIAYNKRYWPAVYQNLKKARRRWGMIVRVLVNTGATVRACGMMYKAVYQLVIIYGSESWVVMGAMLNILEGFHTGRPCGSRGWRRHVGWAGSVNTPWWWRHWKPRNYTP